MKHSLSAQSNVTLREITFETVRTFLDLDVAERQHSYVAANARSIAESSFNPGTWLRGIYADERPAGLILLSNPAIVGAQSRSPWAPGDAVLWRFMIDARFQGTGIGRQALDAARAEIRTWPGVTRFVASFVPGDAGPEGFYLRYGFHKTGGMRANGGEVEIAMTP